MKGQSGGRLSGVMEGCESGSFVRLLGRMPVVEGGGKGMGYGGDRDVGGV